MATLDGNEPIEKSEELYRRIPASLGYYNADIPYISPEAFKPQEHDETGISLTRTKYKTPEEAAQGKSQKGYYLAVLSVISMIDEDITVVPKPLEENLGHCEIPELNFQDRKTPRANTIKQLLAFKCCIRVLGPFNRAESAA